MKLMLVGVFMMSTWAMSFGWPNQPASCFASPILINVGFDLIIGPLFLKTHRLNKICNNPKLVKVKITNKDLLRQLGLLLLGDLIILVTWFITFTPTVVHVDALTDETTLDSFCASVSNLAGNSPAEPTLLPAIMVALLKVVMVAPTCKQAWAARKLQADLNEAQEIAATMYLSITLGILFFVLWMLLQSIDPNFAPFIGIIGVNLCMVNVMGIFFGMKFVKLRSKEDAQKNRGCAVRCNGHNCTNVHKQDQPVSSCAKMELEGSQRYGGTSYVTASKRARSK